MPTKDADPNANALFCRHYSKYQYKDGRRPKKFIGPGSYICLVTSDYSALFVWKKFKCPNQEGINCSIFRNEGVILSSLLILEAELWAFKKWGNERLYTFVNPGKIKSTNPGYCFIKAGWQKCGITKINKLIILEKLWPQIRI